MFADGKTNQAVGVAATPEAIEKAEKETTGTVKMLEDMDGDGRFDHCCSPSRSRCGCCLFRSLASLRTVYS